MSRREQYCIRYVLFPSLLSKLCTIANNYYISSLTQILRKVGVVMAIMHLVRMGQRTDVIAIELILYLNLDMV